MGNVLTKDEQREIKALREPFRQKIMAVADVRLRQWLLAYNGFRNSTTGKRVKVSATMTDALRKIVRGYPFDYPDRKIAQKFNLAIGDVSNVRRGTRR
jgi:hypothetical protein